MKHCEPAHNRVIPKAAILVFCFTILSSFGANHRPAQSIRVEKKVPFVITIEEKQYQNLLDQLPESLIEIDKKAILSNLVDLLTDLDIATTNNMTIEQIAETLFTTTIQPVLEPRVKAFNDLINKESTSNTVSAGFLAFSGLAARMADLNRSSVLTFYGDYLYDEATFEKDGEWTWHEKNILFQTTEFRSAITAKINEDISIDLLPFGKNTRAPWTFSCEGDVTLLQTYGCKLLGQESPLGMPKTSIRLRPNATISAIKKLSCNSYFSIAGKHKYEVKETIDHAAILEIEMTAKQPVESEHQK